MTRQVKTIVGSSTLAECVRLMRDANIGSVVVVVEKDKPVGIFTERDLIRKMANGGAETLTQSMNAVMTKPLRTILPTATVWDAMVLMGRRDIRRLPVIDEKGRLVGILTERDVFRLILSHQNLLLEAVSESFPAATREQLKGIVGHFGLEKPPARSG